MEEIEAFLRQLMPEHAALAFAFFAVGWWSNGRYRLWKWRSRNSSGLNSRRKPPQVVDMKRHFDAAARGETDSMADPRNQLDAIARVNFEKQRLLNRSEYSVFSTIENAVSELGAGYRVMAQTSLGELIRPRAASAPADGKRAYASINSKRLDISVIDRHGFVALAVEYQGEGHHRETAFMRDAVKRESLRRADVPMLEVDPTWSEDLIRDRVRGLLGPAAPDGGPDRSGHQPMT